MIGEPAAQKYDRKCQSCYGYYISYAQCGYTHREQIKLVLKLFTKFYFSKFLPIWYILIVILCAICMLLRMAMLFYIAHPTCGAIY